jgi:hypothetical protein
MKPLRIWTSCAVLVATAAVFTMTAPSAGRAQAQAPLMCPMVWQPTCGITQAGKKFTWANDCWAKKSGATHLRPGACK